MTHEECVVAVYDSFDKATAAVDALDRAGFPHDQVSLISHSVEREVPRDEEEAMQFGDESFHGAAKGAGAGGLLGMLLGTPLLTVGGIGGMLLAGPIATGLVGAVVGGFLGAMGGWGVHTDHVSKYEEKVAEGAVLVIVNGDPQQVAEAEEILQQTDADEVHLHAETSADHVDR